MRRWPIALALFMLSLPPVSLAAIQVAGVLLPEQIRLSPDTAPLALNGAGVHTRYFFVDLYVAALYLPAPMRDVGTLLTHDGPQRLLLHFLRDVSPARTREIWERLGSNGDFEHLRQRREQFASVFKQGLKRGDELAFDYLPGAGTYVRLNGRTKALIPGADFHAALLKIWLGQRPASRGLKRELLGSAG